MDLQRHGDVKVLLEIFENLLNVTNEGSQQFKSQGFHIDCDIELAQVVQMLDTSHKYKA